MTATDPRPQLAAMLLERLAPAAEALAEACAEDIGAGPPPQDDRDRADYHRAGRAGLAHLRQLLAVLDWSARHLPEPEPEPQPVEEPWEPPPPILSDYDGSEDEFHYRSEVYVGKLNTPNTGHGKRGSAAAKHARIMRGRGRKPKPGPHGPAEAGTAGRSMTDHDISAGPHDIS